MGSSQVYLLVLTEVKTGQDPKSHIGFKPYLQRFVSRVDDSVPNRLKA